MFGKLSVALLIAASPAIAQESPPVGSEDAGAEAPKPVAYKTKKVCRTIEVVGSSIPRRTCSTKRIPIKPVQEEQVAEAQPTPEPDSQP